MCKNALGSRDPRTAASILLGAALLLFVASSCGGGGGGGDDAAAPIPLDLGVTSATLATRVGRTYLNPLGAAATVSSPGIPGAFAFDLSNVLGPVGPGQGVNLDVVFTPTGPGPAEDTIVLRWTGGGAVVDQVFAVTATGEALNWTTTPDAPDFGDVLPDQATELDIQVRNGSTRSPVTFTSGGFTSADFSFVGVPFPLALAPGQTATIRVRYAPTSVGQSLTQMRLGSNDVGGPLNVALQAQSTGNGEEIIDLGSQTLTNGETPLLSVDVKDSVRSITFEGLMSDSDQIGLLSLAGPGGKVYEDTGRNGPVIWVENQKVFSFHLPSTDTSDTQLVAGGGVYSFRLQRMAGSGTTMDVRVILEHRVTPTTQAVLPLNIFLSPGLTPNAATAPNDTNLQATLDETNTILQAQGLRLGAITYYDLNDPNLDAIAQGEETALFQAGSIATEERLNLFLVQSVWGGQLLGLSGAIDGAKRNGLRATGVVSLYFDAQPGALAAVIAHEICHYLGLYHTVEITGVFDPISDTAECPISGTDATCPTAGGGLLMHWQGLGGKTLTAGQGTVIRSHPCCAPVPPGPGALRATVAPGPLDPDDVALLRSYPSGWCGTCRTSPDGSK